MFLRKRIMYDESLKMFYYFTNNIHIYTFIYHGIGFPGTFQFSQVVRQCDDSTTTCDTERME